MPANTAPILRNAMRLADRSNATAPRLSLMLGPQSSCAVPSAIPTHRGPQHHRRLRAPQGRGRLSRGDAGEREDRNLNDLSRLNSPNWHPTWHGPLATNVMAITEHAFMIEHLGLLS